MKWFTIFLFFTILQLKVHGQRFDGKLLNKNDSSPLSFAAVKLIETGKYATTNEKGEFSFELPPAINEFHLEISYVGCKTSALVKSSSNKLTDIYVECAPSTLKEIVIEGLTAKEIVKKAIEEIPSNYSDSSYAAPSFFRQYQQVNGKFKNLLEAQILVMFNLSVSKKEITAKESFAVQQLRKCNYYPTEHFYQDNLADVLDQNPIYNLTNSALNPNALNFYSFSFDSLSSSSTYVINYKCSNFTSENHGISNYSSADIDAEGWETGKLTIDKESFAFVKIERKAFRNAGYNYPKNNNFVLPDRKFTQEFVEGHLLMEYKLMQGKWYLKTLIHSYTNQFFRTQTYEKAYTISDFQEWYSDTATRYIDKNLINKFYFSPDLINEKYPYKPEQWKMSLPDFYYHTKESIYKDIEKSQAIEQQFENNSK